MILNEEDHHFAHLAEQGPAPAASAGALHPTSVGKRVCISRRSPSRVSGRRFRGIRCSSLERRLGVLAHSDRLAGGLGVFGVPDTGIARHFRRGCMSGVLGYECTFFQDARGAMVAGT